MPQLNRRLIALGLFSMVLTTGVEDFCVVLR